MSYKDKWTLLLGEMRFREKSSTIPSDGRNPFENDYGRLISSAPIRRLQDKTQVFPLAQSDFIRTRLTHSLEVSYISSSIAQSIEKILLEKAEIIIDQKGLLSSLLRVSGLVHDLGNPPFGHFGEEAIQKFFLDYFEKNANIKLSPREKADFKNFDGNVQTLRILSKLYYFGDQFGYNLTYSSLASIIKYPSDSISGNHGKEFKEIAKKKFGYFLTEEDTYKEIDKHLQLNKRRSPIVYLLEAADDIAYSAADIEDGVKLGIIDIATVRNLFATNLTTNKDKVIAKLDSLVFEFDNKKNDKSLIIQKFRIFTQQLMIEAIINSFIENYDFVMKGELEKELIDASSAEDIRKAYKQLQYIVFDHKSIVKKEIAGWEAIYGLLKIFTRAAKSDKFQEKGNSYESRLFKLISSNHRFVFSRIENYSNDEYKKLQLIVDYISGMTDSFAINLYQELKGIKLE
jgi:dGTPase